MNVGQHLVACACRSLGRAKPGWLARAASRPAFAALLCVAWTAGAFAQERGEYGGAERDPDAPLDEALGGRTAAGNPVEPRTVDDFPAESRDVFAGMDCTPGPGGKLVPLDLAGDQIKGRNTWMLWAGGNEAFWSWLQQYGYGFADFLKLVDSEQRSVRFEITGLCNQPGMAPRSGPGPFGLRLDDVVTPLPNTGGADYAGAPYPALDDGDGRVLQSDGVDPRVYGYPSGVVGIRLFPNPDFTEEARERWDPARYYTDPDYYLDPELVRPLRVGMSCGVCHVGPNPLVPAENWNEPAWENLSSTIGSQYLKTQAVFGNLLAPDNLIFHYLGSQQPGTIDTSLTASDHINNANTMNAVFDIPARLARALENPPERQDADNLRLPSIEDGAASVNPRHTPRVLVDGSDSIGAFGALARVYLNIGTYYEQWNRVQNPIVGVRPQRPFELATCQSNSVYWQVNERYRAGYLAAFFTHPRSTAPMKLEDVARHGAEPHRSAAADALAKGSPEAVTRGREVFVESCMICHSSKQPSGHVLTFTRELDVPWDRAPAAADGVPLRLPADFVDWEAFKRSPSYRAYVEKARALAGAPPAPGMRDPFLADNFLSVDQRVPVTLVGTNSARAVATNGMRGHVWDDFTSEDYKDLPAVGDVRFHNPYGGAPSSRDRRGNNDDYAPPGGGPGYYRPASLISLWATAPYLHNNALGSFSNDPSTASRLANFEDGIRKLLWNELRSETPSGILHGLALRSQDSPEEWRRADPGWIYRTTERTRVVFPAKFVRQLVTSLVGETTVRAVLVLAYLAAALLLVAAWLTGDKLGPHLPGVPLLAVGALSAWFLYGMGMGPFLSFPAWVVPLAAFVAGGALLLLLRSVKIARALHVGLAVLLVAVAVAGQAFLAGRFGDLSIGPFPAGTPVSLILNLDPRGDPTTRLDALVATAKGMRAAEGTADEKAALAAFEAEAGAALVRASTCPDYVLDRGHWFGDALPDEDKEALIAFLRTF